MKKSNFFLATVAALIVSSNLFAQTGPPETPWLLQGNSNVDQNTHYLGTSNTQDLIIKTNATQRMVVSGTTGNVGIGIAAPLYPLHITTSSGMRGLSITNTTPGSGFKYGMYSLISGSGSGPKFGGYFESKNGSGLNYGIKATGNETGTNYGVNALAQGDNTNYGIYAKALGSSFGFGFNYAVYGEVQANTSNAWAGYFLGRGYFSEKVGIGTTTTTGLLNVYGLSTPMAIAIENNYAGAAHSYGAYTEQNGAATGAKFGYVSKQNNSAGDNFGFYSNITETGGNSFGYYSEMLSITGGNKYGFYTKISGGINNNYGVRAEVNDGDAAYGLVGIANGSVQSYGVYGKAEGLGSNWGGYFVGKGYFSDDVGIGTNNPQAQLHIDAGPSENGLVVQLQGASKLKVNANGSVSVGGVPTGPSNGLYVNGNVVIGTSTPATGYKMSVGGKIICEELKVKLEAGWPDYVFADDYKAPSIADLEYSIKNNKHLPGMPSAAEIENNQGYEISAMQIKMMEKIEEQALYIIQLKNEMDELKSLIRSNK